MKKISAKRTPIRSQGCVLLIGKKDVILSANKKCARSLGYSPTELAEVPLSRFVPERVRRAAASSLHQTRQGRNLRFEIPLITRHGKRFWVLFVTSPVYEANGKLRHIFARITDITARKKQELRQACSGPKALQVICETTDWDAAAIWLFEKPQRLLRCHAYWQRTAIRSKGFEQLSWNLPFPPRVGLPGRVWSYKKVIWVENLAGDPNFPRFYEAEKTGLRSGLGIPIRKEGKPIGVLELFSLLPRPRDRETLDFISSARSELARLAASLRRQSP